METGSNYTVKNTNFYHFLFTELADPRTNSWLLIGDPGPPLTILGLWLYFILNLGPKLMKFRKPLEMRTFLITYNFLQVLINIYIFVRAGQLAWFTKYNWRCEPVDFSNSEQALQIAELCHLYFMIKMIELLDTVFFVLRKKDRQITFLHIYHHTVMPMISWGCTKYFPGGHGTFVGFLNSFIHIIMYTYYTMAAIGPQMQKYLWWKKYITTMQMIQFCLIFLHNSQLFFHDCDYPKWSVWIIMPNALFFIQLFKQFYKFAYTDHSKKGDKKKTDDISDINNTFTNGISKNLVNGKIK